MTNTVLVSGSFDDLRSRHVRFLDEASKLGNVHVLLWSDDWVQRSSGKPPKFPCVERQYFLEALRFIHQVTPIDEAGLERIVMDVAQNQENSLWVSGEGLENRDVQEVRARNRIGYHVIPEQQMQGFPHAVRNQNNTGTGKKVVVTGCYDWLHSGHIRFFEEVSQLGRLYVIVGNDENVRLLKGPGHPLFSQDERRYMVASVKYVSQALITSGVGWMDAEPEIHLIQPDMYAVNEDGDKPEKRAFCEAYGIEYVVLKRLPGAGLPRRESTLLRGF